jgi:SAM-dependent methyltransferase
MRLSEREIGVPGVDASVAPACAVCGRHAYEHGPVLWPELIDEWQLAPAEVEYIDVQQGSRCRACGCSVRSIAVAKALLVAMGANGTLASFVTQPAATATRLLEVNEAGHLSPHLRRLPGHVLAQFPEYDLMDLRLPSAHFDFVVHSDTLEHVPDPSRALRECRRVLKPGGALVFSVPIILGRMTRSRAGMPPSYHGLPATRDESMRVHTEFGADVWVQVLEAGFARCEVVAFMFPAGLALVAR